MRRVDRDELEDLPPSHAVAAAVHQDPVEPGLEPVDVTQAAGRVPRAKERVLDRVLRLGAVAQDELQFAVAIGLSRRLDPLSTVRGLNSTIYSQFAYEPRTTRVDSPIDDALRARAGVCQDFAHIMIGLVRNLGIPCRYISGYIAPRESSQDRAGDNATHAWIEAYLPRLGWVGFDPTNNAQAGHRHIAVAVGRDYSDVPPTRGVFKGDAGSELSVAVAVTPASAHIPVRELAPSVSWIVPPKAVSTPEEEMQRHHQQQQQQ